MFEEIKNVIYTHILKKYKIQFTKYEYRHYYKN